MEKREITCDHCGKDLTVTSYCEGYRITLTSEFIPSSGGAVTARADYPTFEQPMHFCQGTCLWEWARKEIAALDSNMAPMTWRIVPKNKDA